MILRRGKDDGGGHKRTGVRTLPAGKVLSHRTHSPTCVWLCEYCLALLSVFSTLLEAEGYVDCYCFAVGKKSFFLGIVSKAFQFLTFSRCIKFI